MSRIPEEQHHIGHSLGKNLHGLEYGEFESLVLLTEFCEENRGNTVQRQNSTYIYYAVLKSRIAQGRGNLSREDYHQCQEGEADTRDHTQCIGIYRQRIHSFLVREAETSGLQTKYQNHLKHSNICHEFCNDAITRCSKQTRIERHEKKVDNPGQNRTQAIDSGLPRELFQWISHQYLLKILYKINVVFENLKLSLIFEGYDESHEVLQ